MSIRNLASLIKSAKIFVTPFEQQRRGVTTSVRIILKEDLPNGRAYAGEVTKVSPGYARNFLIPKKIAVYATRLNFEKLGLTDPDLETPDQRKARLSKEAKLADDEDLKAADLLRHYLRNKVVKIWRNVEGSTDMTHPGMVDAKTIRQKLSKQLKIDLEDHEKVHLYNEPVNHPDLTENTIKDIFSRLGDPSEPCQTQVRQLGDYVARISLRGGYQVPLKVQVLKR